MLELFGVITGLLYMLLEVRQHRAMWIVGFITSAVYVFVFFFAKVYADMGLQLYYVVISAYGFWLWVAPPAPPRGEEGASPPSSSSSSPPSIIYYFLSPLGGAGGALALLLLWGALYLLLHRFTDSPVPLGDAFTTAVGIVATWMLAHRIIQHWYFWIVANTVSIYIYYLRGLYPTMFLYLCYAIVSVAGLYIWKKHGLEQNHQTL